MTPFIETPFPEGSNPSKWHYQVWPKHSNTWVHEDNCLLFCCCCCFWFVLFYFELGFLCTALAVLELSSRPRPWRCVPPPQILRDIIHLNSTDITPLCGQTLTWESLGRCFADVNTNQQWASDLSLSVWVVSTHSTWTLKKKSTVSRKRRNCALVFLGFLAADLTSRFWAPQPCNHMNWFFEISPAPYFF